MSERCIVSLLDRVVEVKPTYILLLLSDILPTDLNKKIKHIIYFNKFKTSNLVIRNNSSPAIGVLQKTNVIYKFKRPLGDCISDNKSNFRGYLIPKLSWEKTSCGNIVI